MTDTGYIVASEGSQQIRSRTLGSKLRELIRAPRGTAHALKAGDDRTACGRARTGLAVFEDQEWGQGIGMNWCDGCAEVVPLG